MIKSLLSTFTHITFKGALSREFYCVQVNFELKSLLSTFTHITFLRGTVTGILLCSGQFCDKIIAEYLYS